MWRVMGGVMAGVLCWGSVVRAAPEEMAGESLRVPRSDGAETPLMVYGAQRASGCAPLAVISHGAGGSEVGYLYLAQHLAAVDYTAVVMGHRESGREALRADMREHGLLPGVQALVSDAAAESARLLDVDAALAWAASRCAPSFRVLLGHSMGAETVMLEAGARNMIGVSSPPAGRDRFDAYVALSPEGPGIVFPDHAWARIGKPVLTLTGTRDQSLAGHAGSDAVHQIRPHGGAPDGENHGRVMHVLLDSRAPNEQGLGMQNLKPFDPKEIDETLTRVVTYGRDTYLLFPYVNATGPAPQFNSVGHVIAGPTATVADFASMTALLEQSGERGVWYISFNTPWLLSRAEAENIRRQRSFVPKTKRE